jgi:iron(III) transport system substrate-binding protein
VTDSDDIAAGQREGKPIAALPMSAETLLIPNTVALIRAAPHPAAARRLFDWLQRPDVVERLIAAHALEGADPATVPTRTLQVRWDELLREADATTAKLCEIFLR